MYRYKCGYYMYVKQRDGNFWQSKYAWKISTNVFVDTCRWYKLILFVYLLLLGIFVFVFFFWRKHSGSFIQKRVNCLLIRCLFSCKSLNFGTVKSKSLTHFQTGFWLNFQFLLPLLTVSCSILGVKKILIRTTTGFINVGVWIK